MADLINNLGGPDGFGVDYLGPNDDGSTGAISLTPIFSTGIDLFGKFYSTMYINNNGNITFDSPLSDYTPAAIGTGYTAPIIAPFWADVYTENGSVASTGGGTAGSNLVWYNLDTAHKTITVTWDDVGYYRASDKVNAFQLQIVAEPDGSAKIKFIYQTIEWVAGSASGGSDGLGGTPARIGYSAGDGSQYYEIPESGTQSELLALPTTKGNTGEDGIFEFRSGSNGIFALADAAVSVPGSALSNKFSFGNVHVNDSVQTLLNIANVAAMPAESLDASLQSNDPAITTSGIVQLLGAGASDSSTLKLQVNTSLAGELDGSVTVELASDGAGTSGAGLTALPSQAIQFTGHVYQYAAPIVEQRVVELGAARVGDGSLAGSITISNGAVSNPYQESLAYSAVTSTGFDITSASSGTIASGSSATVVIQLSATKAGAFAEGGVSLDLTSTGAGTSGLADTSLASDTVTLDGKIYATASASIATALIDFGVVHVDDVASRAIDVENVATGALVDTLVGGFGQVGSHFTGSGALSVAAGNGGSLAIALDTTQSGVFNGSAQLSLASHDTDLSDVALAADSIQLIGSVDNYAALGLSASSGTLRQVGDDFTLDLGTVEQGAAVLSSALVATNTADGLADLLFGTVTEIGGAGLLLGGGQFSALAAGASASAASFTLDTGTAGTFTETFRIASHGSNASGYSGALQDHILTVTGTVLRPTPDISVTAITAPASGVATASASISWTISNSGDAAAEGPWTDNVYLASDAAGDNPELIGSFTFAGSIAAGASVTRTETVTLPSDLIGNGWIVVRADAGNQLVEAPGASSKQSVAATATDILAPPAPELTVDHIVAPDVAVSSSQAAVSWTVTNGGAAAAMGPWTDDVYLANDAHGDNRILLGSFEYDGQLPVGASITRTEVVTLPPGYSGSGWFVVQVDAGNQVAENPGASSKEGIAASATNVTTLKLPDLVVSSITPPTEAVAGQATQISWVVDNAGDGATSVPRWTDKIYLSLNRTLDSSAILLASVDNPSYLAPASSYRNSASITVPQGLSGSYYVIVVTNADGAVGEGANAHPDVLASSAFRVIEPPLPLLAVQTVHLIGPAFSGQPITLGWQVGNLGGAATGQKTWTDTVYAAPNGTLDANAIAVATVTYSGDLAPGQTYTQTGSFSLPVGLSGNETFFVVSDTTGAVYEKIDPQTTAASTTVDVDLTPPPDLEASIGALPAGPISGHSITITYTVANNGSSATPNSGWEDAVYVSPDPTLGSSAILLGTIDHAGALQTGQSYSNTSTFDLPDALSGPYYLFVKADADDSVFEADRTNNVASTPVTIDFDPAVLSLTGIKAPAAGQAGHQIQVSWTVDNTGTGDTGDAAWHDFVILSRSGVLGAADNIRIGTYGRPSKLAAGGQYTQVDAIDLPNDLDGAYTLFVVADADHAIPQASYATDVRAQAIQITPLPQLQVSSVSGPSSAGEGDTVDVHWTVTDAGEGGTGVSTWTDSVYLGGSYLGSVQHSGTLAPGGSYTADLQIALPSLLSTGDYTITVVADRDQRVDEAQDSAVSGSTAIHITGTASGGGGPGSGGGGGTASNSHPQLTVSGITAAADVTSGQPLTVTWTIANAGDATDHSWYDEIYLSATPSLNKSAAIALGFLQHDGALASGDSGTYSQTFTIPNYLSGYYYVIVSADDAQSLSQPSRAGDVAATSSPLQIDLPPVATSPALPELNVAEVDAPMSAADGAPITITYKIANLGAQGSSATWTDAVYLSRTGVWSIDDIFLGNVQVNGIGANATETETLTSPLPGVAAGDYYVIVRSDVYNALPEANAALKTGVSATKVTVSVPTLTLGTTVSGALSAGGAAYYQFTVDAGDVVDLSMAGGAANAANDIYVSYGTPPTIGQFDATSTTPLVQNPTAVLKATQAGTYYVMVRESAGADEQFTLTARTVPFSITSVSPNVGSDGGAVLVANGVGFVGGTTTLEAYADNVTLTINGAQFNANEQVQLVGPNGATATASKVIWADSGELWATFDLSALPVGSYDVRVSDGARSTTLASGFRVADLPVGHLSVSVSAPSQLHTHNPPDGLPGTENGVVTITYANTGYTDIKAPILDLTATNANFIPGANGLIGTSEITVAGITQSGGPAGILQPGATESISYTFHGYFAYAQFITMTLALGVLEGSSAAVDWGSLEAATRPPTIDTTDWALIWQRFEAQVGGTTQSLVNTLSQDETTLSAIGQTTSDLGALLGYELDRASGALTAVTLSSSDDLAMSGSGFALSLSRSYSSSLAARNADGAFGDGWTFTYDIKAVTDASGTVYIRSPNGIETFSLESGAYVAQDGDSSALARVNGAYVLKAADGTIETFRPDGQIGTITDAAGDLITVAYDSNGLISGVTSSNGQSVTFTTNAAGRITSATDSQGQTVTYTYSADGRLLTGVSGPDGTTSYTYAGSSNAYTQNALVHVTNADGSEQNFAYDSLGDLAQSSGAGGASAVTYSYGPTGVVTATDANGDGTKLIYGTNGQVAEIIDTQGNVTQLRYNDSGEVTTVIGPNGDSYQFAYDALGNVTSYTDPAGGTVKATYASGTSELTSFTDQNGNTTAYSYNAAGDVTGITYADGSGDAYAYSPIGLLSASTNARGQTTQYTYDAGGNLTKQSFSDGTSERYAYDATGELTAATATDGGVTRYTYNAAGELTSVTDPQGRVESYGYNASGQLIQRVEPDGSIENFSYTAAGQLASLTDGSGGLIVSYTYNTAGQETGAKMGNGATTGYTYDSNGNVTSITTYAADGSTTSYLHYVYNSLGQPTTVASQDGTWTYGYDASGELTHAVFASTKAAIASQDLTYVYDAAGNRVRTIFNGATTDYTTNNLNEYTSANGTVFGYDADGNLVSVTTADGKATSYAYNSQSQMISATDPDGKVTTYRYDALGNLVGQTANGVTTSYVVDPLAMNTSATGPLSSIAQVYNESGQPIATYSYGHGLVEISNSKFNSFYNSDANGNVVSLSGSLGNINKTILYDPFGSVIFSTNGDVGDFGFAGLLGSNGLTEVINFRSRLYSPNLGRFVQSDHLGINGGINLYSYASNNPLVGIDPTGDYEINLGKLYNGTVGAIGAGAAIWAIPAAAAALAEAAPAVLLTGAIYGGILLSLPEIGIGIAVVGLGAAAIGVGYLAGSALADAAGSVLGAFSNNNPNIIEIDRGKTEDYVDGVLSALIGAIDPTKKLNEAVKPFADTILDKLKEMLLGKLFKEGGDADTIPVNSVDPNEMIGPSVFGLQNFISAKAPLAYTIDFENAAAATAPAQSITITQQLDSNLDWRSFRLTGFGFDNETKQLSGNSAFYGGLLDYSATKGFDVSVSANVDVTTGLVKWTFQTIDPATGLPPTNPQLGLLPPDNANDDGLGYVSYTIQAKAGAATGTTIGASARIVFDTNGPIDTTAIIDTLDAVAPTSAVAALPAQETDDTFEVSWSGHDDPGGSGIAAYTIYVAEDGGALTPWLVDTTRSNALFTGQHGHAYAFYSQATDNVGNQEVPHTTADATTELGTPAPTGLALTPASDTGASQTDDITNDKTPVVTGLADPGSHVTLRDGTTTVGTGVADATTGLWSIASASLADGIHVLTATAVNASGSTSPASPPLTVTIDSTAPVVAIANPSGTVASALQTIAGTVDVADAHSTVAVLDGTSQIATATVAADGSWSVNVTLADEGLHVLTATDVDAAGNKGASSAVNLSLVMTLVTTKTLPDGSTSTSTFDQGHLREVQVTGIVGRPYVSSDTLYGPDGAPTALTKFNADGSVYLGATITKLSDGGLDYQFTSGSALAGKSYAAFENIVSPTGALLMQTLLNSSGAPIQVDYSGRVDDSDVYAFPSGTYNLVGPGTSFDTAGLSLAGVGTTLKLAEDLSFAGPFSQNHGLLNLGSSTLTLSGASSFTGQNGSYANLLGSGQLINTGSATLSGVNLLGSAQFRNSGTVTQTGSVGVGDASDGTAAIVNSAGATWSITNNALIAGDSSKSAIVNDGTLIKFGGTGTTLIRPTLTSSATGAGLVEVASGRLEFARAISGHETLKTDTGTTLALDSGASAGTAFVFEGAGTLQLFDPGEYAGTIDGFKTGAMLDLRSIAFSGQNAGYDSASTGSGTLVVSDGVHTANLAMLGAYTRDNFHLATDKHGGTAITLVG